MVYGQNRHDHRLTRYFLVIAHAVDLVDIADYIFMGNEHTLAGTGGSGSKKQKAGVLRLYLGKLATLSAKHLTVHRAG